VTENGPCKVSEDGQSTIPNAYGWNQKANVLWLDQPSGVGYSYGEENDNVLLIFFFSRLFFLPTSFVLVDFIQNPNIVVFNIIHNNHVCVF
jgi:hypothetical protein